MKQFKKAAAVLLGLVMALQICTVFGQMQEYYQDDFNQFMEDETMPWSGYPVAPGSDVFAKFSGSGGKILASAGRDGKAVLQLTTRLDGNNAALRTKDLTLASGDEMIFSVDFCISDWGSHPELLVGGKRPQIGGRVDWSGNLFYLGYQANGSAGAGLYFEVNNVPQALCEPGTWYTLTVLQNDTQRIGIICDEDGVTVAENTLSAGAKTPENVIAMLLFSFKASDAVTTQLAVQFDNASLGFCQTTVNPPSCVGSSIESGAADVPRNQKLVFTFDQKIFGSPILMAEGTPVADARIVQNGFNRLEIMYDGLLAQNTTYTISFADVQNAGGLSCDTEAVTFTTENLHPWEDITVTDAVTGTDGMTQISFSVTEGFGYPSFSGAVLAAVYANGQMKALDMVMLDNEPTGSVMTKAFSLGAGLCEGEALRLMLLDVANGPVPLAAGSYEGK